MTDLKWHSSNNALKLIFIAGNEPFTQGPVNYAVSCNAAARSGVTVNTIFCGDLRTGVTGKWKDGADLTNGQYMGINHDRQTTYIKTPYDEEIVRLGQELNKTYIVYGRKGTTAAARQSKQDTNAAGAGKESAVQRSLTKASRLYRNEGWDLVDAEKKGRIKITEMKAKELPAPMQKMTAPERKAYLKKTADRRNTLQKRINTLNKKRTAYLTVQRKKSASDQTLDTAMMKALKKQALIKNYQF